MNPTLSECGSQSMKVSIATQMQPEWQTIGNAVQQIL